MRGVGFATASASLVMFAFACGTDGDAIPSAPGTSSGEPDSSISSVPSTAGDASDIKDTGGSDTSITDSGSDAFLDAADGEVDSGPITLPVTVSITSITGPRANIRVVFSDATGAVIESVLTGADGKAKSSADAGTPAMASALLTAGRAHNIVTWTNVEAGDDLKMFDLILDADLGSYDVTMPGEFLDAGATSYEGRTGDCTSGNQPPLGAVAFTVKRLCVSNPNTGMVTQGPVLAIARQGAGGPVGYAFKKGNPLPSGNTINVSPNAWQRPSAFSVTVSNPPNAGVLLANLSEIADGVGFNHSPSPVNNLGIALLDRAPGFADALQSTMVVANNGGASASYQSITKHFAPTSTIAFDASNVLGEITSSATDKTNPHRPVLTWGGAPTTTTDGGLIQLTFKGPPTGTLGATFRWTFIVPPGTTTVTGPAMPPEGDAFLPAVNDAGVSALSAPVVAFFDYDALAGYKAYRQNEGVVIGLPDDLSSFPLPPLPADGTARATLFVP